MNPEKPKTKKMELSPKSLLGGQLVFRTNIDCQGYLKFIYKHKKLTVEQDGHLLIETFGDKEVKYRGVNFRAEGKALGINKRLVSDEITFFFDWGIPASSKEVFVGVICNRDPGERYIVASDISQLIKTVTKIRVESVSSNWNKENMLLCLAYFWAFFEQERTYY